MAGNVFKNTYEIDMDAVSKKPLLHWILAGSVLPIVNKDKPTFHKFSERGINGMITNYQKLTQVTDEKSARTVIEYMDKENRNPVILLYPTGSLCAFSREYESNMNRETYNDLQQQLNLRINWMQIVKKSK